MPQLIFLGVWEPGASHASFITTRTSRRLIPISVYLAHRSCGQHARLGTRPSPIATSQNRLGGCEFLYGRVSFEGEEWRRI